MLADLASLGQALHVLIDLMRQTGVGALPLLDQSTPLTSLPTEEQLLADITKAVEVQYAKQKRLQENAAVVYNLLSTTEQAVKKP